MSNLIDQTAVERLRQNVYLHSNTDNFIQATTDNYKFKESKTIQRELEDTRRHLERMINTIKDQCNLFYKKVGLANRDKFNADNGEYTAAGANEFSLFYLQKDLDNLSNDDTDLTRFLSIINSREFEDRFAEQTQPKIEVDAFTKEWTDTFLNKNGELPEKLQILTDVTGEISAAAIRNTIDQLFNTNKIAKQSGRQMKVKTLNRNQGKKVREGLLQGIEGIDPETLVRNAMNNTKGVLNEENVKKLRDTLINKYVVYDTQTPQQTVDIMWRIFKSLDTTGFIEKKNNDLKDSGKNFETIFKNYFTNALNRYKGKNLNIVKNKLHRTGMYLEEGYTFGLTIESNFENLRTRFNQSTKDFARVIGQNTVSKIYNDSSGNIRNISVESGTDVIVYIGGQKYTFQAKNTISDDSDWSAIRLQEQIKVDTFANRVFDERDKNTFEYLVFNRAFLSKHGVDKDGEPRHYTSDEKSESYIKFFMNKTLAYLLAGKIKDIDNPENRYGNMFFVYKGKYLIPVSMFLIAAYQLILKLQNKTVTKIEAFGSLQYNKRLVGTTGLGDKTAEKYRQEKLNYFKLFGPPSLEQSKDFESKRQNKDYRYPTGLVKIGKDMGKRYIQGASFGKITFSTNLKVLDDLLKTIIFT